MIDQLGPWKLGRLLGSGAFSDVYEAKYDPRAFEKLGPLHRIQIQNHQWVLKVSSTREKKIKGQARGCDLLFHEYNTYRILREAGVPVPAMPMKVRDSYQEECEGWAYIALQRFVTTLERRGILDDQDFFKVASRISFLLELLHKNGYAYRDLKSENVMVDKNGELFLVDMGAMVKFIGPDGKRKKNLTTPSGTPMYMSINVHQGVFASGRDDLESMCFMLFELYTGSLPWYKARSVAEIVEMKKQITPMEMMRKIENVQIRHNLIIWLKYLRLIEHDEEVNYTIFQIENASNKRHRTSAAKLSSDLNSQLQEAQQKMEEAMRMYQDLIDANGLQDDPRHACIKQNMKDSQTLSNRAFSKLYIL